MAEQELIPHLFRTEYSRIVAVLCKLFGFGHMEVAEDIASDTFLTASETWGLKGLPDNPKAWLYAVAKNKAKNVLKHQVIFDRKIAPILKEEPSAAEDPEIDLSPEHIQDSQLQMMFAICDPAITTESQIGLALRILCGFGINEIADAFLTNKETINKRLHRGREKLRAHHTVHSFPPPSEINARLEPVLRTLYLLFNEGYYSTHSDTNIRQELCLEAMRLTHLLTENERTDQPEVSALLSLMSFHASRFEARVDANGEIILYDDQDTALWDRELITQGETYLNRAARGNQLSRYHLEAGIACWHTIKEDTQEKWENILQLYNHLLQLAYSPIAALNRTYALAKANGKAEAIESALKLKLDQHHLYHVLLGELYRDTDNDLAVKHLKKAMDLAKSDTDRKVIRKKIGNY